MVTDYQRGMDHAVREARLYAVPVEIVMHRDMLANWRRRIKRLDRAGLRAVSEHHHTRTLAIAAARRRLATGRLS